jgi:protein-arginine deiminase
MGWIRYVAIAIINTFGVVIGVLFIPIYPSAAVAQSTPMPVLQEFSLSDSPQKVTSVTELYKLRDRLRAELNKFADFPELGANKESWQYQLQRQKYDNLVANIRQVEAQILLEEEANKIWQKGIKFANDAAHLGTKPNPDSQIWQESQKLWQNAIDTLHQIPQGTFLSDKAIEKIIDYQGNLAQINYQYQITRSAEEKQGSQKGNKKSQSLMGFTQKLVPQPSGFSFLADTNRDGIINEKDLPGREQWTFEQGALMLFNNLDKDRNGKPDWQDQNVHRDSFAEPFGHRAGENLAKVQLKLTEDFTGAQIYLVADRVSLPYVNVFQKTDDGWQIVDISGKKPLEFSREIILGVEAKQYRDRNWSGIMALKAVAIKNGKEKASDTIQIGVTPWLMSPNTQPVKEVYVSDRGDVNQAFVEQVKSIVETTESQLKILPGGSPFLQDDIAIGYVQFPTPDGIKNINVALSKSHQNDNDSQENYGKSLMNRDFGWFTKGKARSLDLLNQSMDEFGNLQITPPLPNYPQGRVYYGNSGTTTFNPEIIDFINAQQIQGPPVDIDTSWLLMGHVDEIINFIPSQSGKPLMLIVSPESGIQLLEELAKNGYSEATINRELSTQTTVKNALNNQALILHNQYLQRTKINPLIVKLKREFQLSDEQIIQVPVMFGYSGYAWWPNLVNAVFVNGQLLVSNPRGAWIEEQDYTQEKFRQNLAISGVKVNFLDDKYYHELKGNTYSAINTTRKGEEKPFWQGLPKN